MQGTKRYTGMSFVGRKAVLHKDDAAASYQIPGIRYHHSMSLLALL